MYACTHAHADTAMQRQLSSLISAVASATAAVVGSSNSTTTNMTEAAAAGRDDGCDPAGGTQGDSSHRSCAEAGVVPVVLWRLLRGADALPSRIAGGGKLGGSGAHASVQPPVSGPHAHLLRGMCRALGVSEQQQGSGMVQEGSSDSGGSTGGGPGDQSSCGGCSGNDDGGGSAVWQPSAAHVAAAHLLHLVCRLAPHTSPLLHCMTVPAPMPAAACGGTPPLPPPAGSGETSGGGTGVGVQAARAVQLAAQLASWAGSLHAMCLLCGGPQGVLVVAQWRGWRGVSMTQPVKGTSMGPGSSGASLPASASLASSPSASASASAGAPASAFWLLLGDALCMCAHTAVGAPDGATAGAGLPSAASAGPGAEGGKGAASPGSLPLLCLLLSVSLGHSASLGLLAAIGLVASGTPAQKKAGVKEGTSRERRMRACPQFMHCQPAGACHCLGLQYLRCYLTLTDAKMPVIPQKLCIGLLCIRAFI
eukprot:1097195-Pelagomonas_calceolata.AAC.4